MITKKLERLRYAAAVVLVVLVLAACAIRLRGDEPQANSPASADGVSDPLATKLAECRSVTSLCRKAWAEKWQKAPPPSSDDGAPREGPSLFVPPKDESRPPSGYPPIQQTWKE